MPIKPFTPTEIYTRLLCRLTALEEGAYVLGHYYKAQDDFEKGQGFLAVGGMFRLTSLNITNLATKTLHQQGGFR